MALHLYKHSSNVSHYSTAQLTSAFDPAISYDFPRSKTSCAHDVKKKPWKQNPPLHNRWHPDIPSVAEVQVGELFRIEMVDASGGKHNIRIHC